MISHRRLLRSAALILVGSVPILLLIAVRRNAALQQNTQRLGRFTAEQILARSEPIAEAFSPAGEPLRLTADPVRETVRPIWTVSCTDMKGREVVYLRWNAQTGDLISAGATPAATAGGTGPVDAKEALQSGRTWVQTLGWLEAEHPWHFERPVYHSDTKLWQIKAEDGGRHLTLNLDSRANRLLFAAVAPSRFLPPKPGPDLINL